jgi:ATP-dependent Clp protease protease subunit
MGHRRMRADTSDAGSHHPGWPPDRPSPARSLPGPDRESHHRPRLDDWLQQRLFDQRLVLLFGYLDWDLATRVVAQMVALDALGGHRITMHVDCPNGDVEAALLLMDTVDTLHVPVHGFATGLVGGAALGVLASAHHRTAFPHARFQLVEPHAGGDLEGAADRLVSKARQHEDMLTALVQRLARVALRAPETIHRDLREGRYLTAFEAVQYGLVEGVASSADRRWAGSGFRAGDDR